MGNIIGGVVVGVVLVVFGWIIREPVSSVHRVRGQIAADLVSFADCLSSPGLGSNTLQASEAFRRSAGELWASSNTVFLRPLFAAVGMVPCMAQVRDAYRKLIFLSNGVCTGGTPEANWTAKKDLKRALKLSSLE